MLQKGRRLSLNLLSSSRNINTPAIKTREGREAEKAREFERRRSLGFGSGAGTDMSFSMDMNMSMSMSMGMGAPMHVPRVFTFGSAKIKAPDMPKVRKREWEGSACLCFSVSCLMLFGSHIQWHSTQSCTDAFCVCLSCLRFAISMLCTVFMYCILLIV